MSVFHEIRMVWAPRGETMDASAQRLSDFLETVSRFAGFDCLIHLVKGHEVELGGVEFAQLVRANWARSDLDRKPMPDFGYVVGLGGMVGVQTFPIYVSASGAKPGAINSVRMELHYGARIGTRSLDDAALSGLLDLCVDSWSPELFAYGPSDRLQFVETNDVRGVLSTWNWVPRKVGVGGAWTAREYRGGTIVRARNPESIDREDWMDLAASAKLLVV